MLSFVVAMSENHIIGKDGTLPWHLPEDLKKFKEITLSGSKTMIMGRKTFESLPRILPGRKHIVLTQNKDFKIDNGQVEVIHSIESLKPYIDSEEEFFVIGGGKLFSILLPYTKRIYLTVLHHHFQGDTYMPQFDMKDWKIVDSYEGLVDENNIYRHTYMTLEKL
ncbi:dihydrofolate reductase [Clostridium swellfunianum]|uniref:dihydrofolate reductase n=1 Tax=Clostridium swellfunianum TaxID=1367462 RepID=UPI002030D65F|nr:dihydrofolate reductase [Clostridium swellfunianum]MCM0647898.1 dihydrofolate reductase [Clostridium swellfunianum]